MAATNRVKVEVYSSEYIIQTTEEPSYVEGIATQLDADVRSLLEHNEKLSLCDALVLCAMNYLSNLTKAESNADRLRGQVNEYLKDAARARMEGDEYRRELEKVKKELSQQKK